MTKRAIWSCDACRNRKVKCEKSVPMCANCTARGCECTWQDQEDYERMERLQAQPKAKRSKSSSASPPMSPSSQSHSWTAPSVMLTGAKPEQDDLQGVIAVFGNALGLPAAEVAQIRTLDQARQLLLSSRRASSQSTASSSSSVDSPMPTPSEVLESPPPPAPYLPPPEMHFMQAPAIVAPQLKSQQPFMPIAEPLSYAAFPTVPFSFEPHPRDDLYFSYGHAGELSMGWSETDPLAFVHLG